MSISLQAPLLNTENLLNLAGKFRTQFPYHRTRAAYTLCGETRLKHRYLHLCGLCLLKEKLRQQRQRYQHWRHIQ